MNISRIIYLSFILISIHGCKEIEKEAIHKNNGAPDPVSGVEVENIPGGGYITYDLPTIPDLLYVKGSYTLKDGKVAEQRSSLYNDTLKILGFGDTDAKEVTITTVNRSNIESQPVSATIHPEEPPVHSTFKTVKMIPDFGGVQYSWQNETNASLAFILLARDSTGNLLPYETVYSAIDSGVFTLRGFPPVENDFGIIVRDRWDNYSDTLIMSITPLFEEALNKREFNKIILEGDHEMDAWGARYEHGYDDNIETFNHTWAGTGWPQMWTLDLGSSTKLSRANIVQRRNYFYSHGNPRQLEIWGTNTEPVDGSFDGWTKLCDCEASRPTLQGGTPDEDQIHYDNGDNYNFKLTDPAVRYVRFVVKQTWGNTGFIHFGEVSFWGQKQ
ncbi:DUF5000 domain-containing lipoprotein [Membranihabitans marinus]|uniref:DUF5000 domain-containing lipoprotein n=1 Tax=Membranihabitans marinus TaxID=1227546 RepID=UPI001F1DE7ED|nr:DUF5000 domain-containing lipoprotein [Membranihabitans marinus]